MEERKLDTLMSEREFQNKLNEIREQFETNVRNGVLYLRDYSGVKKFKSIRRAIRKGLVSPFGEIYPKRPFKNKRTKEQDLKRKIYYELKRRATKSS